jgi:shikimate dehydrogenase
MPDRVGAIARAIEALVHGRGARNEGRPDVLVGLIGRGIQLSRTPAMHEREAARLGLRCSYVLIDFDTLQLADNDLSAALDAAAVLGFHGVNVTYPFKQDLMPLLDGIADDAAAIGAVNTVVFGRQRIGHNTDCWGFAESFRTGMAGAPLDHAVMFGAGGAGSAVGYALMELGAGRLSIVDAEPSRAEILAKRLDMAGAAEVVPAADMAEALAVADGIVNTTPVGMAKHPGMPFSPALLRPAHWVADVIYFPQETELLRAARALGCRTLPGIGMAIGQAARAFELFTGRVADMAAMADHFEAAA